MTCDPCDDTVGHFESTVVGVASAISKHDYATKEYKLFYESLLYLMELEEQKYTETKWQDPEEYEQQLV